MRTIILFFIFIISIHFSKAQDLIIMKNGDDIKCKIIEEASDVTKFKKADNPDGPIQSRYNNEIFKVFYQIGTSKTSYDQIILKNGSDIRCIITEEASDVFKYKKLDKPNGPIHNVIRNDVFFIRYKNGTKEVIGKKDDNKTQYEGASFNDSRDGHTYKTVKIGTQTWMAENLNYNAGAGCWCFENKQINCNTYGSLYNWQVALRVCPSGWHLPTDEEWTTLTDFLGGEGEAGGKLKATTLWARNNDYATNSSGFNALPSGYRSSSGNFDGLADYAYFWSSTENRSNDAWRRYLYYGDGEVNRNTHNDRTEGFSVRCVKD